MGKGYGKERGNSVHGFVKGTLGKLPPSLLQSECQAQAADVSTTRLGQSAPPQPPVSLSSSEGRAGGTGDRRIGHWKGSGPSPGGSGIRSPGAPSLSPQRHSNLTHSASSRPWGAQRPAPPAPTGRPRPSKAVCGPRVAPGQPQFASKVSRSLPAEGL